MTSPETELSHPDQAAHWAVRLRAGLLAPADRSALAAWLEQDAGNQALLDGYRRLYMRIGDTLPDLVEAGRIPDVPKPRVAPMVVFRRLASGLAVAAALALAAIWWTNRPQHLDTQFAQRQSIVLKDGSQLDLNARTSLAVRLRSDGRYIRLEEGEAFFSVTKNPARPFFVETSAGTIRVTGTRFNVRNEAGKVDVTVLEGSVAVTPQADEPRFLSPQDQMTLEGGKVSNRKLSVAATQDVIAWREGRIVFDSEPLARAVAQFAHYHGREIAVAPNVGALELGGVFRLDDLDQFLTDVAVSLPVQVLRSPDGPIRIVAR